MCSSGSNKPCSEVSNGCPTPQASGYERTTADFLISPDNGYFQNIGVKDFALVIALG
jgi:hypothetical protein